MAFCSGCKKELPDRNRVGVCTKCRKHYDRQRRENFQRNVYHVMLENNGCEACGFNHPRALEVHHLSKGDKRFAKNGSRSQSLHYNKQDIEMGKAIILCANCHLLFHSHFGGRRADFPDQTKQSTIDIINQMRAGVSSR